MKKPISIQNEFVDRDNEVWCSSSASVGRIALDIMQKVMKDGECKLACIGPASVNNGVKAIIQVRGSLGSDVDIQISPYFSTFTDGNKEKTRIVFQLTKVMV